MPGSFPKPGKFTRPARSFRVGLGVVGVLAVACFAYDLPAEPHFVDESANVSLSYYTDLLLRGARNDPAWLEYPAYDHPPGIRYLIGLAWKAGGYRLPGPAAARLWYHDTSSRFEPPGALTVARLPTLFLGVLGCMAIYFLGTLARDGRVGGLAALFLMLNPLYRLHARRAMSDVPTEAFTLLALAAALWGWRRWLSGRSGGRNALAVALAGVCAGLAAVAKLNGALAMIIIVVEAVLVLPLSAFPVRRRLQVAGAAVLTGCLALATFLALNPFLTAHPDRLRSPEVEAGAQLGLAGRVRFLIEHRMKVSQAQRDLFPHNALTTRGEKLKTLVVQGFGRFGLFGPRRSDSTKRYDRAQDWGALVWLPCVVAGVFWAWGQGRRQLRAGAPPTAWAILVQSAVALIVVAAYLPLAWDRYFLPLQPGSALLAAGAVVAGAERLARAARSVLEGTSTVRLPRLPETWVFVILLGSYAFFWHSRDWNSASRLMLTYALVDRGTIALNGLNAQTRDIAFFQGRYYTDKLPGFSLLATVPYALAKGALRLPDHPLNRPAVAYWPADYWVALGTSGLLTACTGVLLVGLARDLGCGPRRAALVALAYGLATPAYAYATMSYGHQASAFALLTSFALLWRTGASRPALRVALAGFLAAYAAVIEIQVGPVSAILGFYLIAQVIGRQRRPGALGHFAVGAVVPTVVLLGYNQWAFGSPWDMGYFHEVITIFREVHNARNPLGLERPDRHRALALLWGGYRGLLFYAPIVAVAVPGWVELGRRRWWGMGLVSALVVGAVFLVNLSYPNWTGGWCTGPRLLIPLLPFAMLPVAAALASGERWTVGTAVALTLAGGVLMLLFQGAGARIPQDIPDPLRQAVWPLWQQGRLARNLVALAVPDLIGRLTAGWRWVQFVPLVAAQAAAIAAFLRTSRARITLLRGSRTDDRTA